MNNLNQKEGVSDEETSSAGIAVPAVSATASALYADDSILQPFSWDSGVHGWLIHFLYDQTEPVYQRDIEKRLCIRRSTVTATLNRMEKNGLIVRESVPEDARLKRIVLTEKAISLHNDVEKECQFFESVLTAGISMEDLEQFQKTLQVMCKNLTDYESKGGNSTC